MPFVERSERGAVPSIGTDAEPAKAFPTPSTALYSTVWPPSPDTTNEPRYSIQSPLSRRYEMVAPVIASLASIDTSTGPTYHPFAPRAPYRLTPAEGAEVSTPKVTACASSARPATSVADDSRT